MLRIHCSANAESTGRYFDEHLDVGDYYGASKENEVGIWAGLGAERLGLQGEVKKEHFKALLFNLDPFTKEKLTPRNNHNRRCGYDFEFSVPKGLSVLYLIAEKEEIRKAFKDAVRHTMAQIEQNALSRFRDKGADYDVKTSNLVYSMHLHKTSRPVKGFSDPQLHMHCYVQNMTWREDKQRFYALQAGMLKAQAPIYQAMFFEKLADQVQRLGYKIEHNEKGWDIAGMREAGIIEKYSRRGRLIERMAEQMGIKDPDEKSKLGALTRENKKRQALTYEEQTQEWKDRLSPQQRHYVEHAREISQKKKVKTITPKEAMHFAMNHAFERNSVVRWDILVATAHKSAVGQVTLKELQKLKPKGLLTKEIDGQKMCTLDNILKAEMEMLQLLRKGRFSVKPLNKNYDNFQNEMLNQNQRDCVRHLLSNPHRVSIVSGRAGVGKSTLMKELKYALNDEGKKIYAYAPTAQASRTNLRQDGFKDANTLAHLLQQKDHSFLKNNVVVVDEIGLANVADVTALLKIINKNNARLICVGDRLQNQAVSGSPALKIMERSGLVQPFHVEQVVRQKGAYKELVESISKGQFAEAIDGFDKAGWIQEASNTELYSSIAKDYSKSHLMKEPNLVIVPTHEAADVVTACIRKELKEKKILGEQDHTFNVQSDLQFSKAQKSRAQSYAVGQVVEFHQDTLSIKSGERLKVVYADQTSVLVRNKLRETIALPLHHPDDFKVYRAHKIDVSKGDMIRITQNGMDASGRFKLNNGDRYKVAGFTKNGIKLEGGKVVSKDYRNIKIGYCETSYTAQGKSVPVVQVLANSHVKMALNKAGFYVALSRGKIRAKVYTDSIRDLKEWVYKPSEKQAALDMVGYSHQMRRRVKIIEQMRNAYRNMQVSFRRSKAKIEENAVKAMERSQRQFSLGKIMEQQRRHSDSRSIDRHLNPARKVQNNPLKGFGRNRDRGFDYER